MAEKSAADELQKQVEQSVSQPKRHKPDMVKAMADATAHVAKMPKRIHASRFSAEDSTQNISIWQALVDINTKPQDLLVPDLWAHIARQWGDPNRGGYIRPWDEVRVRPDGGAYYAELIVQEVDVHGIRMAIKGDVVELDVGAPSDSLIPKEYSFDYAGLHGKWRVLRMTEEGNEVVHDGFPQKGSAMRWLTNHLKSKK